MPIHRQSGFRLFWVWGLSDIHLEERKQDVTFYFGNDLHLVAGR